MLQEGRPPAATPALAEAQACPPRPPLNGGVSGQDNKTNRPNAVGARVSTSEYQGRWALKMRRVILAVSGMLFTVALLIPAASMWRAAAALFTSSPWACGPLYRHHDCFAPEGFGSLAVLGIGLIVTWAGYTKGVRWTWFVMFVIVWVWAFSLFMLSFVLRWRDAALLLDRK